MATLQKERELYAAMYGDESMVQAEQIDSLDSQLDGVMEALYLYQDLLSNVIMFHPTDKSEIAFLKKEIQECKVKKRELIDALNTILKEKQTA